MNLRTYLMIKRASDGAKAEGKTGLPMVLPGEGVVSADDRPNDPGRNIADGVKIDPITTKERLALMGTAAKSHPYYTALGVGGGALLGGGLGYGAAELAGLSGDDLSTAGRLGRYALIGGGALTGGALGGLGTTYLMSGKPVRFAGPGKDKQPEAAAAEAKTAGYYRYY